MGLIYIITHARRINDVMTWSKWQCSQTWFCNFCTLIFFLQTRPWSDFFLNCCVCVCVFVAVFGIISIRVMVLLYLWSPSILRSVFSAVWCAWADRDSIQDEKAHLCWLHLAVEVWWCPFSTPVCCDCVFSCVRWLSRQTQCKGPESSPVPTTPGCGGILSLLLFVVFVSLPVRWSRRLAQCTGPESWPVPTTPGCGGVMVSFQYSSLLYLCPQLFEMIKQTGTVYRTRKLPCADYTWLWRCDGVERQLPFLLERKRAGMLVCVAVGPTAFAVKRKWKLNLRVPEGSVGYITRVGGVGGQHLPCSVLKFFLMP